MEEAIVDEIAFKESAFTEEELKDYYALYYWAKPVVILIAKKERLLWDEAEEIFQNVMEAALLKYESILSPKDWIVGAARYQILKVKRNRMYNEMKETRYQNMIESSGNNTSNLREEFLFALGILQAECQHLLHSLFYQGNTQEELAEKLELSVSALRRRRAKCLKSLGKLMN